MRCRKNRYPVRFISVHAQEGNGVHAFLSRKPGATKGTFQPPLVFDARMITSKTLMRRRCRSLAHGVGGETRHRFLPQRRRQTEILAPISELQQLHCLMVQNFTRNSFADISSSGVTKRSDSLQFLAGPSLLVVAREPLYARPAKNYPSLV